MSRRRKPQPSPDDPWLRASPALRQALAEAKRRFEGKPGIYGVGIGRKFLQREQRYAPLKRRDGGLCVSVFVQRKRDPAELPDSERIPPSFPVCVNGTIRDVLVDVIQSPSPRHQLSEADKHIWPTAGSLNVGRIFSFGKFPALADSGTFDNQMALLGTVGALLTRGGAQLAVSAAHVVIDICAGDLTPPLYDCSIGAAGPDWVRLTNFGSFLPLGLGTESRFTDCIVMATPAVLWPGVAFWPHGFDRTSFATEADRNAAMLAQDGRGFVWCERMSGSVPIASLPVDVLAGIDGFSSTPCGPKHYGWVWPYRLLGDPTIQGDSGAPVFLRAAEDANVFRLLGFHYLYDSEMNYGYAVDARLFLSSAFDQDLGAGFDFA